jgi:hypothetical protein
VTTNCSFTPFLGPYNAHQNHVKAQEVNASMKLMPDLVSIVFRWLRLDDANINQIIFKASGWNALFRRASISNIIIFDTLFYWKY